MNGSVREVLRAASARLTAAGIPDAARDARLLLAEALKIAPDRLSLINSEPAGAPALAALEGFLDDRIRFRPVSQILGRRAFWGRDFEVTRDVLDPRPETETLVALALEGPQPSRILDLGTGSGAILVSLLAGWPCASGTGTDISAAALAVATRNAERHKVAARASFQEANWCEGVSGSYDLIVSNPPYIPSAEIEGLARDVRDWEPHHALSAGPSGLEVYRKIARNLQNILAREGRALIEIGPDQGATASAFFSNAGLANITLHQDMDGRDRVVEITCRPAG
jgi:release factor glutamine methyltransferase